MKRASKPTVSALKIGDRACRLYGLTADEIELVEESTQTKP